MNMKGVFSSSQQLLSEKFFILRRIKRDIIKNVYWSSCKVPPPPPSFLSNFNDTWIFSKDLKKKEKKKAQMSNFMKIRLPETDLLHAEGQTRN